MSRSMKPKQKKGRKEKIKNHKDLLKINPHQSRRLRKRSNEGAGGCR